MRMVTGQFVFLIALMGGTLRPACADLPFNGLGRFLGFGWSDGYHSCRCGEGPCRHEQSWLDFKSPSTKFEEVRPGIRSSQPLPPAAAPMPFAPPRNGPLTPEPPPVTRYFPNWEPPNSQKHGRWMTR